MGSAARPKQTAGTEYMGKANRPTRLDRVYDTFYRGRVAMEISESSLNAVDRP